MQSSSCRHLAPVVWFRIGIEIISRGRPAPEIGQTRANALPPKFRAKKIACLEICLKYELSQKPAVLAHISATFDDFSSDTPPDHWHQMATKRVVRTLRRY
jgi:hypothetical protein